MVPREALRLPQKARFPSYTGAEDGWGHMMSMARLVTTVTVVAGVTTGAAFAADCPQWLQWVCSASASPEAVSAPDSRQDKQISRTKAASHSATNRKANIKTPQVATRPAQSQPASADGGEQELFQAFLEWDMKRRLNAQTNR
jgi:D-alanyl-D-alanine carboxypeptidase